MKKYILFITLFFCSSVVLGQTLTQTRTCGRIFTNWPERWKSLSPASIAADDNKYLSTIKLIAGNSRPIVFTGWNFSIPASAVIEKIDIKIIRMKSGKNNVKDGHCSLVTGPDDLNACGAFPNVANPDYWTTAEKTVNYTEPASGTGIDRLPFQWTPAMINADGFGVFFDILVHTGGSGAVAYIEQVVVTVHYSEPSIASNKTTRETSYQPFHVGVANNPTNNSFLISTTGSGGQPISLRVIDEAGRLLEARSALAANQSFRIGTNYTRGLYFAEITQGTKRKVLKLIKN